MASVSSTTAPASGTVSIRWGAFDSPHGAGFVAASGRGLTRLAWSGGRDAASFRRELAERFPGGRVIRDDAALARVRGELEAYFAGRGSGFGVPVDLREATAFERRVLETLREDVPFGEVISYAGLARRIGRPGAARAVGGALGRNPVPVVVPCHRVIRSDGSLGGYTGGLPLKRRLLAIEGRNDLSGAG